MLQPTVRAALTYPSHARFVSSLRTSAISFHHTLSTSTFSRLGSSYICRPVKQSPSYFRPSPVTVTLSTSSRVRVNYASTNAVQLETDTYGETGTPKKVGKTIGLGPIAQYGSLINSGLIKDDTHQRSIVQALQNLYDEVATYHPGASSWNEQSGSVFAAVSKFWGSSQKSQKPAVVVPRSLYLYGDVGTGKTMLMNLFYDTLPVQKKRRIHFHAFMLDIHARVHQLRMQKSVSYDPIPRIADDLIQEAYILCFDEFQVTDIADAMILRRLMEEMFARGIVLVATSNRHPDELYKNGIQRKSFIPCIELLKEKCDVLNLDSMTDYRRIERQMEKVFFMPLTDETQKSVDMLTMKLVGGHEMKPARLDFLGRSLFIPKAYDDVAEFTFDDLCTKPLSAADFLELTKKFKAVIVTGLRKMDRNEARRFITFIDAMYENQRLLVCSAAGSIPSLFSAEDARKTVADSPDQHLFLDEMKLDESHLHSPLFNGAEEEFAFQRCVSRLVEMQSKDWFNKAGNWRMD